MTAATDHADRAYRRAARETALRAEAEGVIAEWLDYTTLADAGGEEVQYKVVPQEDGTYVLRDTYGIQPERRYRIAVAVEELG